MCSLTLHENETLNFTTQWRSSFLYFVIIYHILHYIIHPSTLCLCHFIRLSSGIQETWQWMMQQREDALLSLMFLPPPSAFIHKQSVWKSALLNITVFQNKWALFSHSVCLHTCISGHVGISYRASAVSWDLDMKRERYEEKFLWKERNPLIIPAFSCFALLWMCVCVCLHQSPTITQRSFPLSQLYHSVSASTLPPSQSPLPPAFILCVRLLSCHT